MELNSEYFRAIIFYNFRHGLTQQQCIDELNSMFGDEAPSRTSVCWWYYEFNRGRSSLQDEFSEGRPKSDVVPETSDAVHQLNLQYRHVSYREIEKTLDISGTSIHSTLHEPLIDKQICSRWIPHNMSIAQRNAPKIRSQCGFTRISPKVNSSRLYGCFKLHQIQQKLLALEALPSKW